VADGLKADLLEYADRGHLMDSAFPELIQTINQRQTQVKNGWAKAFVYFLTEI